MRHKPSLFPDSRSTLAESIDLTIASLAAYGPKHRTWCIAWSGGKDSTALLTLVVHLIQSRKVAPPERLIVYYVDTRMELTPLAFSAAKIRGQLQELGIECHVLLPRMDDRFFVYMFGRGVPPPSNTFRWCTSQIKVEPMQDALEQLAGRIGKVLMLTGVRQGESAQRDGRIAMSCGKDGAECGQGWYQETLPESLCDTLAPLLHWRVCQVWDWLRVMAPSVRYGGWESEIVAEAYGDDEAEEINARTGCIQCPLASADTALDAILRNPNWFHLQPLKELRPLYRLLKLPQYRLRKPPGETRKDGTLCKNQNRMGPLTFAARIMGMETVLDVQRRVNESAIATGRPQIDILNAEEVDRIRELIRNKTWPDGWRGDEPLADEPFDEMDQSGALQRGLFV